MLISYGREPKNSARVTPGSVTISFRICLANSFRVPLCDVSGNADDDHLLLKLGTGYDRLFGVVREGGDCIDPVFDLVHHFEHVVFRINLDR